MRYLLTSLLLAIVVLSSGCDPDGYSCNCDGCYADNDTPQYQTLEDCNSLCDESIPGGCGSLVLHEDYLYSTVQIGDQCWFSENCRYLPAVALPTPTSWDTITPYYYVNGYEGTDVEAAQATDNYETYGVLYNWPAVMTEGICPCGWHIPSDEEWQTLEMSLGMSAAIISNEGVRGSPVGDYMKSTSGWNDYNGNSGNGSNSSGFNGLPGGGYTTMEIPGVGEIGGLAIGGDTGYWWSTSESDYYSSYSWTRGLGRNGSFVARLQQKNSEGFSARCVRD